MSDPARAAAAAWGLAEPELVRAGMNSLYTAGDDVVLRVGPPSFPVAAEVAWLDMVGRHEVRVPRLVREPIERDGVVVYALERIHPSGSIEWASVGAMIRRVHALEVVLPFCGDFPHWQIEGLFDDVRDLVDPEAAQGLARAVARWEGWRDRAAAERVVCHGDVHPGNVLPTDDGPVLIDWDLRCLAPPGWDHAALMTWTERWGGAAGMYDSFAEGYGRSLRGEWTAEALAELRLVVATLLRVRAGRHDPAAAAEAEQRLRFWRGDPDAPAWTAM